MAVVGAVGDSRTADLNPSEEGFSEQSEFDKIEQQDSGPDEEVEEQAEDMENDEPEELDEEDEVVT